MALIRFRPFAQDLSRDLTDIQTQVNRLFDNFVGQPGPSGQLSSGMVERLWAPAADMYETKSEVVIVAELPGLSDKDIHLSIIGDLLTIEGERHWNSEVPDASHYRRERWFGKFARTFSLPRQVDTGQVRATYRDGVLTVKLPKAEQIKPKEIKIDAA